MFADSNTTVVAEAFHRRWIVLENVEDYLMSQEICQFGVNYGRDMNFSGFGQEIEEGRFNEMKYWAGVAYDAHHRAPAFTFKAQLMSSFMNRSIS